MAKQAIQRMIITGTPPYVEDSSAPTLLEDIRLVIWDLDETFWRGALTEGGATLLPAHAHIVESLNARGVMSSICSKNDLQPVQDLLCEHNLWDKFIFPDVSWDPKGPRIRRILDQVQLRPASVLFLDDNPTNRAEAVRYTPGLNVADERFVGRLLDHPRLLGKPDAGLTRLRHYKQMERRRDVLVGGEDATDFLRNSQIKVEFCHDVRPHLARVVELINRTNQLNFTKSRLPEDMEAAQEALEPYLDHYVFQCALVQVSDAYGDHGFCGFYIYETQKRQLIQFCFSCRVLGLGVERWTYEKLGRPFLNISGEVAGELTGASPVDWINTGADRPGTRSRLRYALTARGGCELAALTHYFLSVSDDVVGECNLVRGGLQVRLDHTVILDQARQGLTPAQLQVAERLQFQESDFRSRLVEDAPENQAVILSFSSDAGATLARHRTTGFIAPLFLPLARWTGEDDAWLPDIDASTLAAAQAALDYVRAEFDLLGPVNRRRFIANVTALLDSIPAATPVFIICLYERPLVIEGARTSPPARLVLINRWTRAAARRRPNVHLLRMEDHAGPGDVVENHFHFRRQAYFRLFKAMCGALQRGNLSALATTVPFSTRSRSAWLALRSAIATQLKALTKLDMT